MNTQHSGEQSESNADEKFMEVKYEFTPVLPQILDHVSASVMVTTYQAGKLLVLGVHNGELKISFNSYDQPMGLAIDGHRMALGTRRQIHNFQGNTDVAPSVAPTGTFDVCYIPHDSTSTGSIHGHDLAWGNEGLWVVNTLFSCICTLHENYSFVPRWQPRFITQLIDQDRCHLNGLAIVDGVPRFVTAMSETDEAAGWRPTKATSGVVMEMESGETVARGFAMPHSPRWYNGKLWVLDSGCGALCVVDPANGHKETVATFPGYTRGLSFAGQFAFVGLSRIRETSVFGGVPIAEHRDELKCGVGVVDITSGRTVAVFQFLSGVTEIFAVEIASTARCPLVAGASADGQERDVWIVPPPGSTPKPGSSVPWYARQTPKSLKSPPPHDAPTQQSQSPDLESWLETHPNDAAAWVTLGNLRQEQSRQRDALHCYERAAAADPASIPARQNLGYLQFNLGMPEKARDTYSELIGVNPTPMNRLLASCVLPIVYDSNAHLTEWRNRQVSGMQQLADDNIVVDASTQQVPTAFFWAYQGLNDADIMRLRGRIIKGNSDFQCAKRVRDDSRIRVGFLSAYLRDHTIGRLNIGRIEQLDRSRFHVTVCLATNIRDPFVERFRKAADQFVEVPRDAKTAVELLRSADLDVLVFCDVGMDALCSSLAFSRMAPVQCATWGHPETTGSPTMDYFLSSELLDSEIADEHYTEQLVRMPLTGTFYERPNAPDTQPNLPSALGINIGANVYSCPQSLFKFHPDFDDVLCAILEQDPNGVIVGIEGRVPEWTDRLTARWNKTIPGVAERIKLLPSMPNEQFLNLLAASDVLLDPLHFGGGNSSYEAFACGTPVVTLQGDFLRGRITAAMYHKMGLADMVASSTDDYVAKAIAWGTDKDANRHARERIRERSSTLFSDAAEVRCLEDTLASLSARRHHSSF
jgi:uncharacterized protein (TIGR03032 family)